MGLFNFFRKKKLAPFKEQVEKLKKEINLQECLLNNYVLTKSMPMNMGGGPDGYGGPMIIDTGDFLYNFTASLNYELEYLLDIIKKGYFNNLKNFLNLLVKEQIVPTMSGMVQTDSITAYQTLFDELANKYENQTKAPIGTPIQDSLLEQLITRDCEFIRKAETTSYEEIGEGLKEEFKDYVNNMQRIYNFDFENSMEEYLSILKSLRKLIVESDEDSELNVEYTRQIPSLNSFKPKKKKDRKLTPERERLEQVIKDREELKKIIFEKTDWNGLGELIASHNKKVKKLKESDLMAFVGSPNTGYSIIPKSRRKKLTLKDLVGYDAEKTTFTENIDKFLNEEESSHIFMHGPAGTGKTSLINAVLTEYSGKKFRVVEMNKLHLPYVSLVSENLETNTDYKFLIVIDDINIKEDKDVCDYLKELMDSPELSDAPHNVRVCFIADENKEGFGFGSAGTGESYKELENYFGLTIKYHLPTEDEQLKILDHKLTEKKLKNYDLNEEYQKFNKFCIDKNVKDVTPKTIEDYVKNLKITTHQ